MNLAFLHGWNVRDTGTYGELPRRLGAHFGARVEHIYLGQYVSFHDAVTLDDLARALHFALKEKFYNAGNGGWEPFALITHSTGGPLARLWKFDHGPTGLTHLVMLAPPIHGSALAQLGRSRLSRLKFFCEGVEPGTGILDYLETGSAESLSLHDAHLRYGDPLRPWEFSLIGQAIDHRFYDHLNSYTGEAGSDGVVRVASANPNFARLKLMQDGPVLRPEGLGGLSGKAFGVLSWVSHSGRRMGILTGIPSAGSHPALDWIIQCLEVADDTGYDRVRAGLEDCTRATQEAGRRVERRRLAGVEIVETSRYAQVIFTVHDDRGRPVEDFDLLLTAGPDYSPDELPRGFCVDRQRNRRSPHTLTYYLDADRMAELEGAPYCGKIGIRVQARPDSGLAYYEAAEYRSEAGEAARLLRPNQTLWVDITLRRRVDAQVLRFTERLPEGGRGEPISAAPSGLLAA
jgi:hypothetical protein